VDSTLDDDDAASVYSVVSEDSQHFRPREEWSSEYNDEELTPISPSPFRFDNPDSVGATIKASAMAKKDMRRRALRDDTTWNKGLACFEARRDAWTGARTVRVRSNKPATPMTPLSPLSPRRFFFRSSISSNPPAIPTSPGSPRQRQSGDAFAAVSDGSENSREGSADITKKLSKTSTQAGEIYPVETLVPIPPPLLPPQNPMRASITPAVHLSLYDKVVVHALTPSCPVNLSDMIRACVSGWKRDGEWPPRPTQAEMTAFARRKKRHESQGSIGRRMSLGFLSRGEKGEKEDDNAGSGKGIRKSIQRVLGIGNGHHAIGNEDGNGLGAAKSP
jgi:hypothetical protein